MADEATIANMAAARMGTETRISSLDDDRNIARTIKLAWDMERRAALRDGAFNFSVKRADLAALGAGDVIYPWAYAFQIPNDCLKLLEVLDCSRDDYAREGQVICANSVGPLYIRYVADITEPALWDAAFAHTFSLRLAWRLGRRIAGSAFDQDQCWAEYRKSLSDAKRADALENPGIAQEDSSWVDARWGGRIR